MGSSCRGKYFLYFSYSTELDAHSRCVLYSNILAYTQRIPIFTGFMNGQSEQFALEQLLPGESNSRLAVIYKHMIHKELIDPQLARLCLRFLSLTGLPAVTPRCGMLWCAMAN